MSDQGELAELGLPPAAVVRLAEQCGVRTVRELALQFYLEPQHSLLADLLGTTLDEARQLVERAARSVPPEELERFLAEMRRVQQIPFGVLPPDDEHAGGPK